MIDFKVIFHDQIDIFLEKKTGEHTYWAYSSIRRLFHFFSKAASTCRSYSRRFFALSAPRQCMRSAAVVEWHTAASQLVTRSTRHTVNSSQVNSSLGWLITQSTRHKEAVNSSQANKKQTSKPYCRSSIITLTR